MVSWKLEHLKHVNDGAKIHQKGYTFSMWGTYTGGIVGCWKKIRIKI